VFRAYEPDQDRLVAVKVFRLDVPPERTHQLVAELEKLVAADLTHPAIAAPVAAGISGTFAYLALDFVAADSLDIVLRDHGPASSADALRVATQLGGALDFAAAVGVVHGSLHPRDVLLSPDDTRLIGLGVTRAIERIGVAAAVRRPYTAPERAAGGPWDRRADIFSLAVLIYEMLSGKRVTATGDQAAEELAEVAGADAQALRRVFARALADEPAKRFDSALGFAEALKDAVAMAGAPAVSRSSAVESAAPPVRSMRTPARREPVREPVDVELPLSAPEVALFVVAVPEVKTVLTLPELPEPPDLRLRTPDPPQAEAPAPAAAAAPPPARRERREREVSIPVAMRAEPEIPIVRAPAFGSEPDPIPAEFHEIALETSRNRVWPLFLAVGIGLVVGFAGGYGVATRDKLMQMGFGAADPPAQAAPAQAAPAAVAAPPATAVSSAPTPPVVAAPAPAPVADAPATASAPAVSAAAVAALAAEAGRIVVRSTPEGARVAVDGHDAGTTPATIRDVAHGSHTVRVTRDGYVEEERKVAITAARPAQTLTIELARPPAAAQAAARGGAVSPGLNGPGGLTVDSRPEGASVFVDGKMVGTTPLTIDSVAAGEHSIGLTREGYSRWASLVRVTTGERARVTASLEK
jgi:eukaryotic-like serine/threonine-protein kinase